MECGENLKIEECSKQLRTLIYKEDFDAVKTLLDGFDRRKRKECVDHLNLGSTALYKACELDRYPFIKYFVEECHADVNIPSSTGFPPLYVACSHGDITMCEFLINYGADVNWTDPENKSYLMIFIENGALCRFLISKGVDITHTDISNKSAFCHAMFKSALCSLDILIKCGINPGREIIGYGLPVEMACNDSNPELLDFLICHGADIHANNDMCLWSYLMLNITDHKICEVLIQHGQDLDQSGTGEQTALHLAVTENAIDTLPLLLTNGADVLVQDEDKLSPLHLAVRDKDFEFVLPLLSCGSDPNSRDNEGRSILQSAFKNKNIACLKHLLHYGADVNSKDESGMTNFHYAIKENIDIAYYSVLLKFGAEVNSQTIRGLTPLHLTVQNNNVACCKFLLTHGADANMADEDGKTPLHYAVKHSSPEMISLLCKYGADANAVDKDGMGPIQDAAILKRNKIVEFLLQDLKILNISKIECYELMAADSFNHEEFDDGFDNLRTAITWRQANDLISKPITVVNSILDNVREPETYQDLISLNEDSETMLKQAAAIKARILGPWSSPVLEILQAVGMGLDDESGIISLKIKHHALQCEIKNNFSDEFKITDRIEDMLKGFYELDPTAGNYFDTRDCLASIMHGYERVIELSLNAGPEDITPARMASRSVALSLYQCYCMFIDLMCDRGTQTVQKYFRRFFEICPEVEIVNMLLEELEKGENQLCGEAIYHFVEAAFRLGFSTNLVREEEGSTPLHMLLSALENDGLKIDGEYTGVVELFLKTGTHMCKTNSTGFSILERLADLNYPVCKVRNRTLQCLAAEVIVESKIPYENEVPVHLIPFIKDHKEYRKYMYYGRSPLHPGYLN